MNSGGPASGLQQPGEARERAIAGASAGVGGRPARAPIIWPLQRDCLAFYGDPRAANWLHANTVDVACPWPLHVGTVPVSHILIHKKCAESLARVLSYDVYDGSYNLRVMRGGAALSMHAFACAIDFDAADNVFHSAQHVFQHDSLIVVKFIEEGWVWGGDWQPGSVDAMHFQAARV